MFLGDMVEHQVDHQRDAAFPQSLRHIREIVHGSKVAADGTVVGHRVAAIVGALTRLQQRHQVQVSDPEVTQVVEMSEDSVQGTREPVRVTDIARHTGLLQPVGTQQACLVESAQIGGTILKRLRHDGTYPLHQSVGLVSVDVAQRRCQLIRVAVPP